MSRTTVSLTMVALGVGGLFGGRGLFSAAVVTLAAVALIDLTGLLARVLARPIVVAAFLPAVALPAAVAVAPWTTGWQEVPDYALLGLVAAFLLALAFGRRTDVVHALGGTLFAGVSIGLGASGLLLLHALPEGFRWVLAFLVLVTAAEAGTLLGERARRRDSVLLGRAHTPAVVGVVVLPAAAVAVAATAVSVLLRPPVTPQMAGLLGTAALVGAITGGWLERALTAEAGLSEAARARLGDGLVVGAADAVLLGAPAAFVLAAALG